jgi:hypothetical protein
MLMPIPNVYECIDIIQGNYVLGEKSADPGADPAGGTKSPPGKRIQAAE